MLEAVVQEAGLPALRKVAGDVLGVGGVQGNSGLILVGGQDLRVSRQNSRPQLPGQVAVRRDEPLTNHAL